MASSLKMLFRVTAGDVTAAAERLKQADADLEAARWSDSVSESRYLYLKDLTRSAAQNMTQVAEMSREGASVPWEFLSVAKNVRELVVDELRRSRQTPRTNSDRAARLAWLRRAALQNELELEQSTAAKTRAGRL